MDAQTLSHFMFNTYITRPSPVYVNERREITEKRAPTDESIRLLREMEQAAEDRIVDVLRIRSNAFQAKAYVFDEPAINAKKARVVFSLNDEQYDWTFELDLYSRPEDIVKKLRDEIAQRLAEVLTGVVISDGLESVFRKRS